MPSRPLLTALATLVLAVLAVVARPATDHAGGGERRAPSPQALRLERGETRYAAIVRAETASLRERRAAGDEAGVRIHLGRVAPARRARTSEPHAVVHAAAAVLSLDARGTGRTGLLDLEAHAQGAGLAFDSIREAVWMRDRGLVGSIDERLANLRAELDRHRRGEGFLSSGALGAADRRRLAAALDALAWRLTVAADALARHGA